MELVPETEKQFIDRVYASMKARRHDLRMTQDTCARMLNRAQNWWSVRERGSHPMDLSDATLVAAVLQIPQKDKVQRTDLPVRVVPPKTPTPTMPIAAQRPQNPPERRGLTHQVPSGRSTGIKWNGRPQHPASDPEQTVRKAAPERPTPAVMPKKAEPAPVRVAGVARVPQPVKKEEPVQELAKTFLWKEDLTVNAGANEARLGILAVDGDQEAHLELPIQDARRLRTMLAVKLPHRNTEASAYVTSLLDRVNRALSQSVAQARRTKIMRIIQPEIHAVLTDIWAEVKDVRDGAASQEAEMLREQEVLENRIAELKEKLSKGGGPVDPEDKAADAYKVQTEASERITRLEQQLESLKGEKRTLDSKLVRLREEMEEQDKEVERLKKKLKDLEDNPSDLQKELAEAQGDMDQALAILDEIWAMAEELAGSSSSDNKLTARLVKAKMTEMGYDSE